jgi:hypothetical protein
MARLPTPGKDAGNWGNILNDFLTQAHAADGSLKPVSSVADGTITPAKTDGGFERTANKGVANGYASLDGTGKIPVQQLPGPQTPAIVNFGSESLSTGIFGPVTFGASLNGYMTPPLPDWITISSGRLVFSSAGIYTIGFTPQISPASVTQSYIYHETNYGLFFPTGPYDDAPTQLSMMILVTDDGLPELATIAAGGTSMGFMVATTNTPLGMQAYMQFSGGGTGYISAIQAFITRIQ